ncbi:hypothetical protein B0F90DRAFT_1820352 [Multifurca ochricompacta]|uniref:Uncharacterized protein n=1 Tax=Multifurca ochricompacta TaxID=376703 RepID=A0AAD4LZ19_9AGAM|nr:hypothetical protein B0F90DRAFT_1820352 [Multifurca ochricompacta]
MKGVYLLVDLITEQSSRGPVDKIIIAQQSLQEFIDALSTDSNSSITNVDFKALDNLWLKPIGLYGSKEEIVRFLREINVVDDKMYVFYGRGAEIASPQMDYTTRDAEVILRPGLYAIRLFASSAGGQIYILYWPEDTTWNDEAPPSVQRNRVMFMRYLTKLCDQLICLLSVEHSQGIIWRDDVDKEYDDYDDGINLSSDSEYDDSDRLSHFQVSKIRDEEKITARAGFTMNSSLLVEQHPPPGVHVDPKVLLPSLLHGEKVQGFMTAEFKPARTVVEPFSLDHQTADQIRPHCGANGDDVLCLSNTIDDKSLKILMDLYFSARFSKELEAWEQNIEMITQRFLNNVAEKQAELNADIEQGSENVQAKLREAVVGEVLNAFPSLRREDFVPESAIAANEEVDIDREKGRIILSFCFSPEMVVRPTPDLRDLLQKSRVEVVWNEANEDASLVSDQDFLLRCNATGADDYLHDAAIDIEKTAHTCFTTLINSLVSEINQQILSTHKDECNEKVQRAFQSTIDKELESLRSNFVRQIEDLSRERSTSRATIHIDNFEMRSGSSSLLDVSVRCEFDSSTQLDSSLYSISGRREFLTEDEIEYQVHLLHLHTDQRHNLQQDPSFVPTPVVNERLSGSFHVPSGTLVKYAHLLEGDRILLGLINSQGNVLIYIESLARVDNVIQSQSFTRLFHKDKIGETGIIAFDESKRMLAFCASTRMQLHIFIEDEEFKSLHGMGTAINLAPFYTSGVFIIHACFVQGSGEILFVDLDAQARIFSLTMLQPKPASLQLPQVPRAIYSSPDGSCVLVVQEDDGVSSMRAYHWSTFGATDGIPITLDDFPVDLGAALLTSTVNRNTIHLIGFDLKSRCCRSLILDIKCAATEFTFQEQRSQVSSNQAAHNCLIDCYVDVWTRFPVLPAVKRRAVTSRSERQKKALIFYLRKDFTQANWRLTQWYRCVRKDFPLFYAPVPVHQFRLVGLPFPSWGMDGVLSAQLQASLLGAEVNRIVDTVSFGWYELIFRCYWASKPVKVISSLGEQSVGKSFALNHLVDTCFGPSTMGASDGVWMSVCPSDDALIVALDFEGVSSLRRSAQENALLVLFSTAISNLVLFRNNFSLGEDSNSLAVFQSLQSSSSILDPAFNPSLFQSTLVVIIKDVIASDKADITKEFSHKFQKIVKEEQYSNFVTRLHAGNSKIIPWPLIESREFYRLFRTVKKMLGQQPIVHHTAGEFLYTLRILMAKLTANDWGPISETMASHRANALLEILPNALETGFAEIIPELEPLKDFDTDQVIQAEDTSARFLLPGPGVSLLERELRLTILRESWDRINTRQHVDDSEWSSDLAQYLTHLSDLRIVHVDKWISEAASNFVGRSAVHVAYIAY